jgi:hypothetical protein
VGRVHIHVCGSVFLVKFGIFCVQDIIFGTKSFNTMTLTHPEWNQETGGLAVAKAFADQIRGRNGLLPPID